MKTSDPKEEIIKRRLGEAIRAARSEGQSLEQFLTTHLRNAPSSMSEGGKVVMLGWAVILWLR